MSVTGLPTGTQVWIDDVLKATMSDTSLNLTFNDPGKFEIILKKIGYFDYGFEVVTARASIDQHPLKHVRAQVVRPQLKRLKQQKNFH